MTLQLVRPSTETVPDNWEVVELQEVVDILDSKRVPVNRDERAKRPGDVPYYGATGQVGWIDDYLFDEELVLLGEDGAPFLERSRPKAYIIRDKSWVNNHAHVLRARPNIDSRFLLHALNLADYRPYISGTTRLKLPQGPMRTIPIPLPPLDEQKEIVAAIETQFARLDDAVGALERARTRLKRYRASVLKAACEGRLVPTEADLARQEARSYEPASALLERVRANRSVGSGKRAGRLPSAPTATDLPPLPEGWAWTRLQDIGELARGKSKHRPRNDPRLMGGPYPFVQTSEVRQSGGTIINYQQTYSDFGLAQSRIWPAGTLCITIAANIAETGILTFDACFPDSVVGFITDCEAANTRFVETFIRTVREDLERFAPATAQKNINLDVLYSVSVPLPPRAEQNRIVSELERRLSVLDRMEAEVTANLKRAESLRQAILRRAFSGKLVSGVVVIESTPG
jgi:type I restriction enzyme S subunit